jgi:hypothetical protein
MLVCGRERSRWGQQLAIVLAGANALEREQWSPHHSPEFGRQARDLLRR